MSKSAVDRINQSAKEKAATWIDYLKNAPASVVKAHLCPVFTRASLRPNRISKENVQCWNDSLQIVAFHDPEAEYQPAKSSLVNESALRRNAGILIAETAQRLT